MKHTEYIELTRALESLTKGADTLRLLFSKVEAPADPDTLEPGEPTTRWVPTDQARQHPLFPHRWVMLGVAERTVEDTARLMDQCVDGWTDENQDRADRGLKPTADTRGLFQAMAGFMSATETPTRGIAGLYDKTRSRCRAWLDQANEWFPNLNGNHQANGQEPHQEPGPTSTTRTGKTVTVNVDRDRLAMLFNKDFHKVKPGQQYSPFDMFYFATTTAKFTRKDWGRIAYAIKLNHRVIANNVPFMDFSTWIVAFFEAIGVEPPQDKRPNKYTDQAGTRHFITNWLSR